MNKGKIVAISGKLGSGKGEIVKVFQSLRKIEEKSFAYKLKQIAALLVNVDISLLMTQDGKNIYIPIFEMTLGEMIQKIGTESMRDNFDIEVWIKALFCDLNETDDYIISDCRFKNEAKKITDNNGILIRINRKNNTTALQSGRDLNHASEIDLDDYKFDYVIENDGTYEELLEKIKTVYYQIFTDK